MEVESGVAGKDFMEEEGNGPTTMHERNRRMDDHSSALAEKLLQGWTLLNEHCPQCLTPLVRNRLKKLYCAACRQWVLTEAEAAAKVLHQRADRSDLTEQSWNATHEQSGPSTGPAPGAATQHNGVGQIRLSLASLRADEEKAQDGRSPKRFAAVDHAQDAPRIVARENGNQDGKTRPGVASSFQALIPAPVPPKPALVLQPIMDPVNDGLVVWRTLSTLTEKLESIRQLISSSHDLKELRQLFAILEECIHAIEVTRQLLKNLG